MVDTLDTRSSAFAALGPSLVHARGRGCAMATGVVKWFNASKKYGFIAQEGGPDVFVHANEVAGGSTLREGQRVEFDMTQGAKGPQATNVRLIG